MAITRKQKLTMIKMSAVVLLAYFLVSFLWINAVTVSRRTQRMDVFEMDGNEVKDERIESVESDPEMTRIVSSIDSDRIVNPVSFRYRVDNPQLCQLNSKSSHSQHVFLFVYIHSAPENYMKRLLLRQTWVRPGLYDLPVRFAFFIGLRSNDATLNQAVQLESDHFQDVIQADFEDSYRNLSLKSLSALHWITANCNWTRYVLKTDDDAYVNMRALLQHLSDIDHPRDPSGGLKPRRLILCRIWRGMNVLRDDIKWGVSRDEFPDEFYPAYCSGIAWIMTRDMIVAMDRIANKVKRFWIDDVYITGILIERLQKAGLNVGWHEFGHAYIRMDKMETFDSPLWYRYLFVHLAETHYFARMWVKMEEAAAKYPISPVSHIAPGLIAGHNFTFVVT